MVIYFAIQLKKVTETGDKILINYHAEISQFHH